MYVSFNYFAHPTKHRYRAVVVAFTSVSGLVYWTHPDLLPMGRQDARPQSKINNVREWCGNVDGRKFEQLSTYTVHSCSFVRLSGQSLYYILGGCPFHGRVERDEIPTRESPPKQSGTLPCPALPCPALPFPPLHSTPVPSTPLPPLCLPAAVHLNAHRV